jgi:hypothetical protein
MLLALALLLAAVPPDPPFADAASALRAYSMRAPMFYETELRALVAVADHDGQAILLGGAGAGIAIVRIASPESTAMISSWTALRVGTAARLSVASGAPRLRLEVPFLFGAERAFGGLERGARWRGFVLGAAAAPEVIVGSGLHAAWVRAEMHLDRVALESPKDPHLRLSLAVQAPVGYPETLVALGAGVAFY